MCKREGLIRYLFISSGNVRGEDAKILRHPRKIALCSRFILYIAHSLDNICLNCTMVLRISLSPFYCVSKSLADPQKRVAPSKIFKTAPTSVLFGWPGQGKGGSHVSLSSFPLLPLWNPKAWLIVYGPRETGSGN